MFAQVSFSRKILRKIYCRWTREVLILLIAYKEKERQIKQMLHRNYNINLLQRLNCETIKSLFINIPCNDAKFLVSQLVFSLDQVRGWKFYLCQGLANLLDFSIYRTYQNRDKTRMSRKILECISYLLQKDKTHILKWHTITIDLANLAMEKRMMICLKFGFGCSYKVPTELLSKNFQYILLQLRVNTKSRSVGDLPIVSNLSFRLCFQKSSCYKTLPRKHKTKRDNKIDIISSIIGCCSCFMKERRLPFHFVIRQEWHFSSFVLGIALFSTWIPCLMTRAHVNYRWHVFRVSQLCYTDMHAQQSENIKPNASHIWQTHLADAW